MAGKAKRKAHAMVHPSGESKYGRKVKFLRRENLRRADLNIERAKKNLPALLGVTGVDFPIGAKPWL